MLCPDCPDLDGSAMPLDWTPRARCCRDDHIARRLAGDFAPWAGIETERAAKVEEEARLERRAVIIGTGAHLSIANTAGEFVPLGPMPSVLSSEPQGLPRAPGNRAQRRKREARDRRKGRADA